MIIWIDAQMSPAIAQWLSAEFAVTASPVRDFGLRNATDEEIFRAARQANAVMMTKDSDFVLLLDRLGPPLKLIWVTCGNTSNANLTQILHRTFQRAMDLLDSGEALVEIS